MDSPAAAVAALVTTVTDFVGSKFLGVKLGGEKRAIERLTR